MAANAGEISVELRLLLNKLTSDVAKAAQVMKAGLAVNLGGVSTQTEKSASSMEKLEVRTRRATGALQQQLEAWRRLNAGGVVPGQKITIAGSSSSAGTVSGPGNIVPLFGGGLATGTGGIASGGFTGVGGGGAVPPIIPVAGGGAGGGGGQSALALVRMARAALYTTGVLYAMHKAVQEMTDAFQRAGKLYTSILRSGGMAPGFVVNRANLAEIMGVGEEEVYKFGAAMEYANRMTRVSSETLTKTTPELTATLWKFRGMMLDVKGAMSLMLTSIAPFVNGLIDAAKKIAQFVEQHPWMAQAAGMAIGIGVGSLTGKGGPEKVPAVPTSIDRLPFSAWEKMGLIVGAGGGENYAKRTADNTARLVKLWEKMDRSYPAFTVPPQGVEQKGVARSGTAIISPQTSNP